jgi:ribonuclease I
MNSKLRDQQSYFNQTLSLFEKLNLVSWLQESGITARDQGDPTIHASSSFHNAIEKHTNGKRIKVECNRARRQSVPVFTGFHVCYHPLSLEFADCNREKRNCGQMRFIAPSTA